MEAEARSFVSINPTELDRPSVYRLLLACVSPRPIAFVSSISPNGVPNLAPFSFFMAGGANPPSVIFSPTNDRSGNPKDTLRNIETTGEYVINVVSYEIKEGMNQTSALYPYEVSEWPDSGLTPVPSVKVKPARVMESPLSMECKLHQVVHHGGQGLSANYVIGEVVYFHVDSRFTADGAIETTQIDYIGRMSGDWYARAHPDSMFELERPAGPK